MCATAETHANSFKYDCTKATMQAHHLKDKPYRIRSDLPIKSIYLVYFDSPPLNTIEYGLTVGLLSRQKVGQHVKGPFSSYSR